MKVVIAHGKTKRVIEGPFNICLSTEDLELLVQQLQAKMEQGHGYGWIEIHERTQDCIPNTPPIGWDE